MLFEIENVSLDLISNYLDPPKPDSIDIENQKVIIDNAIESA